MAKKNQFLEELRELGATESQLNQLRQLKNEFEENDIYSTIEERNAELLGESVRPITLSYETALKLLKYNVYGNIQDIIKEYGNAKLMVEQGTTAEYEDYVKSFADRLQQYGVYNATAENLKSANLAEIEEWASIYDKYEAMNNDKGMEIARYNITRIIGEGL